MSGDSKYNRPAGRLRSKGIICIAFALDCHDREIIGWLPTTSGISREMIRDMMVQSGERRFGRDRALPPGCNG